MKYNFLKAKIFLTLIEIVLLSNSIFALTGAQIIENADNYRTFTWTCNSWNARPENSNNFWDITKEDGGKDWRYPFFPLGEPIGPDPDGSGPLAAPTATGQHTGVAYEWGLRETGEVFNEKLGKKKGDGSGYLAGNIDNSIPFYNKWHDYTGIDCSGFVANCVGIPIIQRSGNAKYALWHLGTMHLIQEKFTDEIKWDKIQQGDILIKYESDGGHVALVKKRQGITVDAIDASPNSVKTGGVITSADPRVKNCSFTWYSDTDIRRSDGGTGYQPRRFTPPYLKRIRVLKENIENNTANHLLVYESKWEEGTSGKELKITANNILDAGRYYIELEFSKAMAVSATAYSGTWENILVKAKSGSKEAKIKGIEDKSINNGYFNGGKKIFNGWTGQEQMDAADVFNRWVGIVDISEFAGEVEIYVDATSLMQDKLDSNPVTIAERTEDGGWSNYETGADTNHKFYVVPKNTIKYQSNKAIQKEKYVVITNPQQTPTPALSEGQLPEYPSAYPTATVAVDAFVKGLMLGMTGGSDFSNAKYREGYKAIGVAAYTLLLNEIEKNKTGTYDILVNGYSTEQKYYIPYMDFSNTWTAQSIKDAITAAYNEIAVTTTAYDASNNTITQYYIKTFWPEKAATFARSGDNVEIPAYKPLVFPYVEAKGTTLVQGAIDEIGQYLAYLNTTKVDEDVGVSAPQYLSNCTKAGMSAFAAMKYADKGVPNLGSKTGGGKSAEDILGYFYRPAPVILKKVKMAQNNVEIYNKEWSAAYLDNNNAMRTLTGTSKNATPTADAYMELYFTEKIADGLMILRSNAFKLGIPKVISPLSTGISITASDKYPEIVKLTITASELTTLAGVITGTTKTEDMVILVSCRDELTRNQIDAKPGDVAYSMTDGKEIYQNDTAASDENHHISIIVAQNADPAKQGDDYVNVDKNKAKAGSDVKLSLEGKLSVDMNIQLPKQDISILIPRPDLSGVKWGFDGSKFAIALFPDAGQYLSGWKFSAEMLQGSIGNTFRGIKGPQIIIPPINTGVDLSGIVGQITNIEGGLCELTGNIFDVIEKKLNFDGTNTKTAYGGNIKACGSGVEKANKVSL